MRGPRRIDDHRPAPRARRPRRPHPLGASLGLDWILLLAVGAITGFSLFVIGRSTEDDIAGEPRYYLDRQILFVAVGVVAMIVATRVNLDHVARWAWALWAGLLGSLAIVFAAGEATRGSHRWIDVGPFSLQPSEFGKVIIMIVLAGIALQRLDDVGTVRYTLLLTAVAGVPAAVVFLQPDLGTSLVYAAVLCAILFLVGVPWTHFAVFGSLLAILILSVLWLLPATGVKVLEDYQVRAPDGVRGRRPRHQRRRLPARPEQDRDRLGRHPGQGPRRRDPGEQRLPARAPHRLHLRGDLGDVRLRGRGLLILLYGLILWRGLRTMARASSQTDMLVAGAILAMLGFQVFVNIGMTVGIMPITGIPLPLMSYGGSQTITTLIAVGLLLGIHRRRSPVAG